MSSPIEFIKDGEKENLIIFIHGFTGDKNTWINSEGIGFPNMLLEESSISEHFDFAYFSYYTKICDFKEVNFLVKILKSTRIIKNRYRKNIDISELSNLLKSSIDIMCHKYKKIILIAHSMGGLIAKEYILNGIRQGFDSKVKLFISLAVPHKGSDWAIIAKRIFKNNPQLTDLKPMSEFLDTLNNDWIQEQEKIPKTIYLYGQNDEVANKKTAISFQTSKQITTTFDCDHFEIAKPESKNSMVYLALKKFLIEFINEEKKGLESKKNIKTSNLISNQVKEYIKEANSLAKIKDYEKAIIKYEKVLSEINSIDNPEIYLDVKLEMGIVYHHLSDSSNEKEMNLLNAEKSFIDALEVATSKIRISELNNNIAIIYCRLAEVRKKQMYLEKAIDRYKISLDCYDSSHNEYGYIQTKINLGNAYRSLSIVKNTTENLNEAIKQYQEALSDMQESEGELYASLQNNIGIAYSQLSDIEDCEVNIENSIKSFMKALDVYDVETYSTKYAQVKSNLSNSFVRLANIKDENENLLKAANCCEEALKIRTINKYPFDYSHTKKLLGDIYIKLFSTTEKVNFYELSKECFEQALKIRELEKYPLEYANTYNSFANLYTQKYKLEGDEYYLNQAINKYEEALKIVTYAKYPLDYAKVKMNIGEAYLIQMTSFNRTENVNKAIESFKCALQVFSEKDYSEYNNWLKIRLMLLEKSSLIEKK